MNEFLDISPEVKAALSAGKPVVALESTIISHGMPYPKNVQTAMLVEKTIRENGAVPATVAVIGGRLKAGLSEAEIEYLGKTGRGIAKVSRRDLPVIVARGADGATTVTTTMIIAHMAGISVSSFQKGDCSFRKKNSPPFEIPLRKGWVQSLGFTLSFAPLVLSLYDAPGAA
jgi:pseudouridine-5'-phosphate glycosidase